MTIIIKKIKMPEVKIKINDKIIVSVIITLLIVGFFNLQPAALAESQSITELNIEKEKEKIEGQLDELQRKADAYQKIIDLKRKQQATYDNQVSIMENEIYKLEMDIEINNKKLNDLNSQIEKIKGKIIEKEAMMRKQRMILTELIKAYYENNRQNIILSSIQGGKAYSITSKRDRLAQLGDKIGEIIDNIKSIKNSLDQEKETTEKNKDKVAQLTQTMEERNADLENSKKQKEALIAQTKGEESRYQQLLQRVEEQKQELLGDIDDLYNANSSELDALAASLEKPDSKYWASTSWYYSQKDSRWGNNRIGQSKSLLKDYGCAITDAAMVFTYHGQSITPKSMAKQPIYSWDLINWPASWSGGIKIDAKYGNSHGNINWSVIDKKIESGNPVIVFIKAKGSAGHYVVVHHKAKNGKYVVHDPYFGSNIYLDSTIKLLGRMYNTSVSKSKIDQMIIYEK